MAEPKSIRDKMNPHDLRTLSVLRACEISGEDPICKLTEMTVPQPEMRRRFKRLERLGLMIERKCELTQAGRDVPIVVLMGGVFDGLHFGHLETLTGAKLLGDVLAVVVATDNTVKKLKGTPPIHTAEEREILVNQLDMVDACRVGEEDDIFATVKDVKQNIIALGYDQVHQEKDIKTGCEKIGIDVRVVRLQTHRPELSSFKMLKDL